MLLINCKVELSLDSSENCILSTGGKTAIFTITDTKLYIPAVSLLAEGNAKLSKLLRDGFKRSVYWNKYKVILNKVVPAKVAANNEEKHITELLDSSYQVVKRFLLIIIQQAIIKLLLILSKKLFLQDLK